MKSGYNIVWADEALNNLDEIIDYLLLNWTEKEIRNFSMKLDKTIELISNKPLSFPKSVFKTTVHRCVLSKQTTIYYEISGKVITILSLFDTRKNPNSIKIS